MVESFSDVWAGASLAAVEEFLAEKANELWAGSKVSDLIRNEYERVESIRASLERVLAWLATVPPPLAVVNASERLPLVGVKQRARGRICFKCRTQIRSTRDLLIVCPVWVPGLPVHESCFKELEQEFGGRR